MLLNSVLFLLRSSMKMLLLISLFIIHYDEISFSGVCCSRLRQY